MKKLILAIAILLTSIGHASANMSVAANQVQPNCSIWTKNLTCADTDQQKVDNAVDQLVIPAAVVPAGPPGALQFKGSGFAGSSNLTTDGLNLTIGGNIGIGSTNPNISTFTALQYTPGSQPSNALGVNDQVSVTCSGCSPDPSGIYNFNGTNWANPEGPHWKRTDGAYYLWQLVQGGSWYISTSDQNGNTSPIAPTNAYTAQDTNFLANDYEGIGSYIGNPIVNWLRCVGGSTVSCDAWGDLSLNTVTFIGDMAIESGQIFFTGQQGSWSITELGQESLSGALNAGSLQGGSYKYPDGTTFVKANDEIDYPIGAAFLDVTGNIHLPFGGIYDSTGSLGTNGQILSSNGTLTLWENAPSSGITALTGDVTATGPGSAAATLKTVNSNVGTFQGLTINGKGLVTAATNQNYLTGNQTITASGDATGSGTTSLPLTLATVNSNVGSFTNSNITVNAKGLITAASNGTATPTAANPTGTVGLSTVNGSATTFMRSDAAPPLSQAIVPIWTGTHTFNGTPSIITTGNVGINTTNPQVQLYVNGTVQGGTVTDGIATLSSGDLQNVAKALIGTNTDNLSGAALQVTGGATFNGSIGVTNLVVNPNFTSSSNWSGTGWTIPYSTPYVVNFVISSANHTLTTKPTVNSTFTNNGSTFTVTSVSSLVSHVTYWTGTLVTSSSGLPSPSTSGTLTFVSGTGVTFTYTSFTDIPPVGPGAYTASSTSPLTASGTGIKAYSWYQIQCTTETGDDGNSTINVGGVNVGNICSPVGSPYPVTFQATSNADIIVTGDGGETFLTNFIVYAVSNGNLNAQNGLTVTGTNDITGNALDVISTGASGIRIQDAITGKGVSISGTPTGGPSQIEIDQQSGAGISFGYARVFCYVLNNGDCGIASSLATDFTMNNQYGSIHMGAGSAVDLLTLYGVNNSSIASKILFGENLADDGVATDVYQFANTNGEAGNGNSVFFGNVGIGTFNPQQALIVKGTENIVNSSGTTLASMTSSGGGYFSGNVGIGTTLSTNALDIAKNVSIGTAYAGYNAAPANGLIVQGNVGLGTYLTPHKVNIACPGASGEEYCGCDTAGDLGYCSGGLGAVCGSCTCC